MATFSLVCTRMICRFVTAVSVHFEHLYFTIATRLSCSEICSVTFIVNFLEIVSVKEFLKSVNIW